MECQILRVSSYTRGSISNIGREEYRNKQNNRNSEIDEQRKHLNITLGNKNNETLFQLWKKRIETLKLQFAGRKDQIAMEQTVITASPEFFKKYGWDIESAKKWTKQDIPKPIMQYFNDSLKFLIGYYGKENIISATIHFDETTPHMHVDSIPSISGKHKRKDVYLKDENGKCIRNEKGKPIRAKDSNGKTLYEYVDEPPSINRALFWAERGGAQSYRKMQDMFYEKVAKQYNLERGEVGTDREHQSQYKHKAKKLKEKIVEGNEVIHKQAEHIERQRTEINNNNKAIIKQNETIDELNKAIIQVQKDEAVMAKLEQSLGIKKTKQHNAYAR